MGIGDILLGKKKLITYSHLKSLHYSMDEAGLVASLDDVADKLRPFALDLLYDLAMNGRTNVMVGSDLRRRLDGIFTGGDFQSKKSAMKLCSALASQGWGAAVIGPEMAAEAAKLLSSHDDEIRQHIAYLVPEIIRYGLIETLIVNGATEGLIAILDSDEPTLLIYALTALQGFADAGCTDLLRVPESLDAINLIRMHEDSSVMEYADHLFRTITDSTYSTAGAIPAAGNVQEAVYTHTEDDAPRKGKREETLQDRVEDGRYVRPGRKREKHLSSASQTLSTDGRKIGKVEESGEPIELKARQGTAPPSVPPETQPPRKKSKVVLIEEDDFEMTL